MKMRWSKDNSILLSKVCVWVFAVCALICAAGLPVVLDGIVARRGLEPETGRVCVMASFYALLIPTAIALWNLYRLLANISREEVFEPANVRCLRELSWACFLAAVICLVSASYYIPFLFLAVLTGFMGLILRVVKNVFAEAVALKQENDYTI